MIRASMDPRWIKNFTAFVKHKNDPRNLFNARSPWFIPLCNALTSISNFPDLILDPVRTEGGFFNETLAFVAGSDRLKKGTELQLNFNELYGNIIITIIHMWVEFMAAVAKNEVVAYPEEIDQRRLCYTVSIYRFLLEEDYRHIAGWAKATGCFPLTAPLGALFNVNDRERFVTSAEKVSVSFLANVIEYNDPVILWEFNKLASRYWYNIDFPEKKMLYGAGNNTYQQSMTTDSVFISAMHEDLTDPVLEVPAYSSEYEAPLNYNRVGLPFIKSWESNPNSPNYGRPLPYGPELVYRYQKSWHPTPTSLDDVRIEMEQRAIEIITEEDTLKQQVASTEQQKDQQEALPPLQTIASVTEAEYRTVSLSPTAQTVLI
jgi:hypothetical protein